MSRVNIHEQVVQICESLGIDYSSTSLISLDIKPARVRAIVLKRNAHGCHYIDVAGTGKVATETLEFEVTT